MHKFVGVLDKYGQLIRSYVKWGMVSFHCYGNLDPGEMHAI